ncbi:hypothetical protein BS47DRAFT_1340131 [Hydnum rufescens UP504]|uniref:F-box domain-containing protein n=1 Tax=Hydnum rufescens UP504 TaxID=1448309 RepID=A0A9P6DZK3_9AGAM|nr:hypothetical protein BS47DRAFT_1340131 [Hydnum rufescens UP504]
MMANSAASLRKAASTFRAQITKRLRSESVQMPVMVPYDVICIILEYADMSTLFAMSLVNRACSEAAYKYLWRQVPVHFCNPPHKHTVNLLKTLVSIPLRTRQIREFVITATDFKPAGTRGSDRNYISPAAHKTINTFVSLLPYATSLRIIRFQTHQLFNHYFREIIADFDFRILHKNPRPFPFRLISLHAPASHFHALSRLISQQPSIRHLSLSAPNEDNPMSPISSDILPHLESLTISSPYLSYVMGGRPVHTLDLTGFPLRRPTVSYLLDAIEQATTPLRSLMVSVVRVDDRDSVKDDLSQLAMFPSVAPELRELVIKCPTHFPNWDGIVGEKTGLMSVRSPRRRALRRFTEILSTFQVLEVLEWIGPHASSPEQGNNAAKSF